eukprot:TRINITY_DN400_c8_g1_i1.p2 TRINITY_DN400_c8_g1~~TRINITY_DN400_c8_g1_i1.p2  ORF type:complete len:155 (+),score=38.84 TRINITY_DN400_c8_g1_i1:904-1368(+)
MMKSTSVMLVVLFVGSIYGVLPPLSKEHKWTLASHVLVGVVERVDSWVDRKPNGFENTVYDVDLNVSAVEKGSFDDRVAPITFWKWKTRSRGWAGDTGLYGNVPHVGDQIRAYVIRNDTTNVFEVLKPNGLEFVRAAAWAVPHEGWACQAVQCG